MAKPTQQELMAAHNTIAINTAKAAADLAAKQTPVVIMPVDLTREPLGFEVDYSAFGGNRNNKAVAARIAKTVEVVNTPQPVVALTAAEAAKADLAAAKAAEAAAGLSIDPVNALTDDDGNLTAAGLLKKQELEAANALIQANQAAADLAALDAPVGNPKAPATAPVWKAKA